MKIVYYQQENEFVPGIATEKGIIPVNKFAAKKYTDEPLSIADLTDLSEIEHKGSSQPENLLQEENLLFGPCVPEPSKIICIGLNYRKHAVESGMAIPTVPVVFTKYNNTLTTYGADVELGPEGQQFDYEVELGVVIGRKCKHVAEEDALDYVLGYCVANDLSCRDLQFLSSQWLLGKSLDGFLPLGKYLVTADEVGNPQDLRLTCSLNGEQRQNSSTADMIFSVAEIVSFLSRHMTLEPGDLIVTGTPEGVIMGLKEKNWLKPGDVVQVEIEKLGSTINRMI
jgi:2-keto-4-pentenoate hydratase/2-oxohepta-3-ene-1,7-dioic acid hydratase in catechol pathway